LRALAVAHVVRADARRRPTRADGRLRARGPVAGRPAGVGLARQTARQRVRNYFDHRRHVSRVGAVTLPLRVLANVRGLVPQPSAVVAAHATHFVRSVRLQADVFSPTDSGALLAGIARWPTRISLAGTAGLRSVLLRSHGDQ